VMYTVWETRSSGRCQEVSAQSSGLQQASGNVSETYRTIEGLCMCPHSQRFVMQVEHPQCVIGCAGRGGAICEELTNATRDARLGTTSRAAYFPSRQLRAFQDRFSPPRALRLCETPTSRWSRSFDRVATSPPRRRYCFSMQWRFKESSISKIALLLIVLMSFQSVGAAGTRVPIERQVAKTKARVE